MNISDIAIKRVSSIKWFHDVGSGYSSTRVFSVEASEAAKLIVESEWEDVTLRASNEISGFLAKKHGIAFQSWNKLAKDAREFFEKQIVNTIPSLSGFDKTLVAQCIGWDIVHFLIEDAYIEKLPRPLFFENLVKIYECGNLPCGWKGPWPQGELLIY